MKTLVLGVALALPGLLPAVTTDYDAYTLNLTRISENRRNPGEMGPVATGDFNSDGVDDIAFGSPRSAALLTANSGNVFVIYGSDPLLATDYYDLTAQPDQASNGLFSRLYTNNTEGFQLLPERGGEQFGQSLASGDFDGDGIDDLAIGAPALIGGSGQGAVYLLYGRDDSITTHPLSGLELIDNEIFDEEAFEVKGNPSHQYFGEVAFMADLDVDGYDDLVVGSPNNPVSVGVEIIWGRPRNVLPVNQRLHRAVMGSVEVSTVIAGALAGERMGSSFAAYDFAGGLSKELFIGCPGWPGGPGSRGRVIQVNISKPPSNFNTYNAAIAPLQYRATAGMAGADFGFSIAMDQLDPDAPAELVIGAPKSVLNKGEVYIVKPGADGITSHDVPTSTGLLLTHTQFGAKLGYKVAIQSVDGFAGKDLVVGAPGVITGSGFDHGRAYVITGAPYTPGGTIDVDIPTLTGVSVGNFPSEMGGGANLAFGDFDATPNPVPPGDTEPRQDIVISGTGQSVYDPACTSNNQGDWVLCNGQEVGLRAFIGRSAVLSTSDSSPTWSLLP